MNLCVMNLCVMNLCGRKRDSNHKLLPLLEVREVNQNGSSGAISGGGVRNLAIG